MPLVDTLKNLPPAAKYGGAAGIAGLGFIIYRKRKNAASANSSSADSSSAASTGTGTSLQTGIDPSTGVPYSQEEAAYYDQSGGGTGGNSFNPYQLYGPPGAAPSPDNNPTTTATAVPAPTVASPSAPTPASVPPVTSAMAVPPATTSQLATAQLAQIPNPTIGSEIAAAGVPWVTIGGAQFYDPSYLTKILNPAQGSQLTNEGYKAVTIGGSQYFNPAQKVA